MQQCRKITLVLTCLVLGALLCPHDVQTQENRPPVLNPIGNKTITERDIVALVASAEDPDGDPIEYSVWQAGDFDHNGHVAPLDVLKIIQVVNNSGGVTIDPDHKWWNPEMDVSNDGYISPLDVLTIIAIVNDEYREIPGGEIDPATGYFSWQPHRGYVENNNLFTFVASDGTALDAETVRVAVTTRPATAPAVSDPELLDETEARSAHYFYREALPNGLVKDGTHKEHASIAATGFGLAALAVTAERYGTTPRWFIPPALARRRANRILDTCLAIQARQPANAGDYGIAGFLYHFVDADGKRQGECEVSTVDTALLLAGAVTAGEYFGGEVKTKANELYNNINWDYFLVPSKNQFSHGWKPETGMFSGTWDRPGDETMLISLLAIGSEPANVEFLETMFSWPRAMRSYKGYNVVNSYFGSLFTYYFAHIFFDFEKMGDDNPYIINSNKPPVNWWTNSVNATLANRQFCIDESGTYTSYGPDSWGITPCELYTGEYLGKHGARPCEYHSDDPVHDGTIAPSGAISVMPLMRTAADEALGENLSFRALKNYYNTHYTRLWFQYGPRDSFTPEIYCNPNYIGINVGPQVLMIENYRSGLLWDNFMKNDRINAAVDKVFRDRSMFLVPDNWPLSSIEANGVRINEKITVTNDGNMPVTYSLSVKDAAGQLGWQPAPEPDVNKYTMSAIFTDISVQSVNESDFGPGDLLSETPKKPIENGINVLPGESRALWLKFNAPRADTTNREKHEQHFIYVEVKAE